VAGEWFFKPDLVSMDANKNFGRTNDKGPVSLTSRIFSLSVQYLKRIAHSGYSNAASGMPQSIAVPH
jgi:hypothetical protein